MGVLDGKTAFILGASAGIAKASAELLAADGATLYLLGRSMKRLEATRDDILDAVPEAEIVLQKGDPEDETTVEKPRRRPTTSSSGWTSSSAPSRPAVPGP